MNEHSATTELTTAESLEFLRGQSFGRLAVVLNGKPDIYPINFAIHVPENDASRFAAVAYIRTSPGNKLFASASGFPLALEADQVAEGSATSVIVYGRGRLVQERTELELVETLGLDAWIAERKPEIVAIDLDRVSGRRFRLGPAPEYMHRDPSD